MKSRLEEIYKSKVRSVLAKELGLKNVMQIPRLVKVVINTGAKDAVQDGRVLNGVVEALSAIAGQHAVKTKARKSIAGFKLREGLAIGCMVTLRGDRMYHFLDKLINVALPSVRDFRGVGTKFDGNGNYNLGFKDWMVFPEIEYDKVEGSRGLNVTIHTSAEDDKGGYALLKGLGMPFVEQTK